MADLLPTLKRIQITRMEWVLKSGGREALSESGRKLMVNRK
jgi:hypothetical protein